MHRRPLLMIPGPIEVSEAVISASSGPPPSHLAPGVIADFSAALQAMRHVWLAGADHQPFAIAGSGTIAMEMAVVNLLDPGEQALVIDTGYFSSRMSEMLRRRGVAVTELSAEPGTSPPLGRVDEALSSGGFSALFATHVDTSTGVRVDAESLSRLARENDVLSVFDGVCATAGERFEQSAWAADVYLTSSQKAIGMPAGLALMVASPRALSKRNNLTVAPPMCIDWEEWQPIMNAYEELRPSYFSTPATTLICGLRVALDEILSGGPSAEQAMATRFALHQRCADALRAGWRRLGLSLLPDEDLAANTLSAIRYPASVGAELVGEIKKRGVIVAGGLHPAVKNAYFRVGHMGHILHSPEALCRVVRAVGESLTALGAGNETEAAVTITAERLSR